MRRAMSLIEVLVSISIIGLLLSLVLAAIQYAREGARRTTCQSNLKQCALACLIHENTYRAFPTGGWGGGWVGDPSRGTSTSQPGGWVFNVLPFLEQQTLHKLGSDANSSSRDRLIASRLEASISAMNCPTRRDSISYPIAKAVAQKPRNSALVENVGRSDYAMVSGDQKRAEINGYFGPDNVAQATSLTYRWPDTTDFTGLGFLRSHVRLSEVKDGSSNTYLVGEKYVSESNYDTGRDHGDDWSMYTGFQDDIYRSTNENWPPSHDSFATGDGEEGRFGSAHEGGWFAATCDGAVTFIGFGVDVQVHKQQGNKADVR